MISQASVPSLSLPNFLREYLHQLQLPYEKKSLIAGMQTGLGLYLSFWADDPYSEGINLLCTSTSQLGRKQKGQMTSREIRRGARRTLTITFPEHYCSRFAEKWMFWGWEVAVTQKPLQHEPSMILFQGQ